MVMATKDLLEFAWTDRQREAVLALSEHGTKSAACKAIGCNRSSFHNLIKAVKKKADCQGKQPPSDVVIKELRSRNASLEKTVSSQTEQIERLRGTNFRLPLGKRNEANGKSFCRVVIPDTHGCVVNQEAIAAFFGDLETISPKEIVMLGDHLECGGFLAQHHTLGYVAQTEYTFEEDVLACNTLLDRVQSLAPSATIDYIEGNHERRIENWCVTQALKNQQDASYLRRMFSTEAVLALSKRGINWIRQGVFYDGLPLPATIKRGHCYFTHGSSTAQHAASAHVRKFGGNVVYGHCFSSDTEVLTQSGWKTYQDMCIGSTVGTINLKDGTFEWQQTTDMFEHHHYKEMIRFAGRSSDILVTHDHAMVTTSRCAVSMKDSIAQRRLKRVPARELMEASAFTFPLSGVNRQADYPISDDMLRFCVWVITEGNVSSQGRGGHIRIAQSDNPQKGGMIALEKVLFSLNVKHSKSLRYEKATVGNGQYRNYDAYRYNIKRSTPVCDEFARLCPDKTLQPWMLKLSSRQWEILFETLILADGCKHSDANNSYQYATNKPIEADLLQALCAINGCRTSRTERTRRGAKYSCITVNTRGLAHFTGSKPEVVPYSGSVWCCSVPNQTLVLRRKGKVFVAGNTHRMDEYTIRNVASGTISAWSPGCLCNLQPLWLHTNPTDWTHGYGLQLVNEDGTFLHINVPIIDGKSYLQPLVKAIV